MARPIAADHDEKRTQLLKAAAQVFAREGLARASMAQIARACGVSKANIYHYYGGKEALLYDLLETYLAKLRDRVLAVPLEGLSPQDKLHALTREILRCYDGMDAEHKIQSEGIAFLPEAHQAVLKKLQRDIVQRVETVLAELAPPALAADRTRLRAATMSVFGMLNWFYMWNRDPSAEGRLAYARLVADMTIGGIGRV